MIDEAYFYLTQQENINRFQGYKYEITKKKYSKCYVWRAFNFKGVIQPQFLQKIYIVRNTLRYSRTLKMKWIYCIQMGLLYKVIMTQNRLFKPWPDYFVENKIQ